MVYRETPESGEERLQYVDYPNGGRIDISPIGNGRYEVFKRTPGRNGYTGGTSILGTEEADKVLEQMGIPTTVEVLEASETQQMEEENRVLIETSNSESLEGRVENKVVHCREGEPYVEEVYLEDEDQPVWNYLNDLEGLEARERKVDSWEYIEDAVRKAETWENL